MTARMVWSSGLVALSLAAALLTAGPVGAVTQTSDTTGIITEEVAPTTSEISVRLSEQTPLPDTSTVVIARDDRFADALASGVLQGTSPMLLVPSVGAVPDRVLGEINRLGATQAIILGGDLAVSADVEAQIAGLGVATERRQGDSRFETAVAIAGGDAADADTAILARAFPASGSTDESQAFADTLGVGALSAETGWPILLTETARLTAPTREYLTASAVSSIKIIGGTLAVGAGVEQELVELGFDVERIAADDRFGTAVEVSKERGIDAASDAAEVILVDGQFSTAWAGGLASAARAALLGSPIVLSSGGQLPPATAAFLEGGTGGGSGQPLTCVAFPDACERARVAVGLPPVADVAADVPDGAVVTAGTTVTVSIDPGGRSVTEVVSTGTCTLGATDQGSATTVTVQLADPLPTPSCELIVDFTIPATGGFAQTGAVRQREIFTYTTFVPPPGGGVGVIASGAEVDARTLASNLVGRGVQVFNTRLVGAADSGGLFAGGADAVGFDQGIALSTGFVTDVVGPNDFPDTTGSFGTPGDPFLTALAGSETLDAVILAFDFVAAPDASQVRFDYVFGSEEYTEFVDLGFNDVFAFTVNGENCATVGGQPVSIDTINDRRNTELFRPNEAGELNIELDGMTTTLSCVAPIVRGGQNHLELAIADASDSAYDSAVFIRAASFQVE